MSDQIDVQGGYGGTSARLQDLASAYIALRAASDSLSTCGYRLRTAYDEVRCMPSPAIELDAARANAINALADAALTAGRQSAHANVVADRLERTAAGYADAERQAGLAVALMRDVGHSITGFFHDMVSGGAGSLLHPRVVMPRLLPSRDVADAALNRLGPLYDLIASYLAANAQALSYVFGDPYGLTLTPERTTTASAPTGVEDLLLDAHGLEPSGGGDPGEIMIERHDAPDGSTAWVVTIPGTEDWLSLGGKNPFTGTANLSLAARDVADPMVAVAAAMAAQHIPPGDPVMLVGHSQGGMSAMGLANTPEFRERYNLRAIVTAGSPTARYATVDGVATLHVENVEDITPGLDGGVNPDTPERITVSRSLAASDLPADQAAARSNTGSHYGDAYARTGAYIDASDHPSLVAWRGQADVFFGDDGDHVTRTVYSVERGVDAALAAPGRDGSGGSTFARSTAG